MKEITTVGVDLAKEVIAVCGADRSGKTVFTRVFRREAFAAWAVQLPPCVFGLEACRAATIGRAGSRATATRRD